MADIDPKQRFTSRTADYVAGRPGYPEQVIDVLEERIGFDAAWTVADIGAGTGISAELFLNNKNPVFVVEPNDAMRQTAQRQLARHKRATFVAGEAAATRLLDESIDLVVAAQAFHWFDRPAFAAECRRICRRDGYLLLMWNERLAAGSRFAEAYEQLLIDHGTDYTRVDHRTLTPAQIAEPFAAPGPVRVELPNEQWLDYDTLLARLRSSSYTPAPGSARYDAMVGALRQLFDRTSEEGRVLMQYRTELHIGRVHGK